jgi:hypothetical protein
MGKILVFLAIWGTCMFGWVMNIVSLTTCNFNPITAEPVLRVVGIFAAPLGVVLGFIPHF